MPNLTKIAQKYLAYESSDISDFQRKSRILQSMWREEKGYEIGEYRGKKRGNFIPEQWAKETLNNYLSDTIKEVVKNEIFNNASAKLYGKPRIFNNLLSSQPLCFNLFAELQQDLELATKVFQQLCPHRVNKVTSIDFEYSPGKGNMEFLGDRSAFDVYVEFSNHNGKKGFIGIEVKYHENLKNKPAEMKDRYFEVARDMDCFKKDCFDILQKKPLEQIWRDHLLAGSLLYPKKDKLKNDFKDKFKDGFFVFLYPQNNLHCQEAVEQYRQCLTIDRTFQDWTLEKVAGTIKQNTDDSWIYELIDRYLDFEKLER